MTQETRTTQGPWFQSLDRDNRVVYSVERHVASCVTAEDARLIAAAPHLLNTLRAVEAILANIREGHIRPHEKRDALMNAEAMCSGAASKATA